MKQGLGPALSKIFSEMDDVDAMEAYAKRHGLSSKAALTVLDDNYGRLIVEYLRPRIEGRTVVEIGGGVGLLALQMGHVAKRVYCIEANPMWAWAFANALLHRKPRNVSFLLGAADQFLGCSRPM